MLMGTIARLLKWPLAGGHCVLCGAGEVEDVRHFLLSCDALLPCRERMRLELKAKLGFAAEPGAALWNEFKAGEDAQLRLLLGGRWDPPARPAMVDKKVFAESCGLAMWTMDKVCKNYAIVCWRVREAMLGRLSVEHGALVRKAPEGPSASALLARQMLYDAGAQSEPAEEFRPC